MTSARTASGLTGWPGTIWVALTIPLIGAGKLNGRGWISRLAAFDDYRDIAFFNRVVLITETFSARPEIRLLMAASGTGIDVDATYCEHGVSKSRSSTMTVSSRRFFTPFSSRMTVSFSRSWAEIGVMANPRTAASFRVVFIQIKVGEIRF